MAPTTLGRWEALLKLGIDIGLVCARRWPEGGGILRADQVHSSVPLFDLNTFLTGRGPYYVYLGSIAKIVKTFAPDLIHFREEVFTLSAGQFLFHRRLSFGDIPFVFESHQNIRKTYPWPSRWFESIAYRKAMGAVAGVPSVEKVLREGGYEGPVEMIPLGGIEPTLFTPDGADVTKVVGADAKLVGYVGRLDPEKGVDDLIRAVAGSKWRLVVLGDGPERQNLEVLASRLKVDAFFVGAKPQDETPNFLRTFDVVVVPSRTTSRWKEQWGRVITEAMACGTPVIGSDSGEIPWVIGDAGLVYPEGSVEALRETIRTVLQDESVSSRLRDAGLKRAADFTWEQHALKTAQFYQRVLS